MIRKLDEAFLSHFRGEEIDKVTFFEQWKSSNGASRRQIAALTLFRSIVILQLIKCLHVLLCSPPVLRLGVSALYQHPAGIYNDAKKEEEALL